MKRLITLLPILVLLYYFNFLKVKGDESIGISNLSRDQSIYQSLILINAKLIKFSSDGEYITTNINTEHNGVFVIDILPENKKPNIRAYILHDLSIYNFDWFSLPPNSYIQFYINRDLYNKWLDGSTYLYTDMIQIQNLNKKTNNIK